MVMVLPDGSFLDLAGCKVVKVLSLRPGDMVQENDLPFSTTIMEFQANGGEDTQEGEILVYAGDAKITMVHGSTWGDEIPS